MAAQLSGHSGCCPDQGEAEHRRKPSYPLVPWRLVCCPWQSHACCTLKPTLSGILVPPFCFLCVAMAEQIPITTPGKVNHRTKFRPRVSSHNSYSSCQVRWRQTSIPLPVTVMWKSVIPISCCMQSTEKYGNPRDRATQEVSYEEGGQEKAF